MTGETSCSIGELARRTGLTVKTIRFYADRGLVPPTDRTPAGYRRYDATAIARLDLVRTLRALGLDLATIRGILDQESSLPEVAAAHADALDVQIRVLRQRRAVLAAVARRGCTPEEMELVHRLATLSEAERQRLISDFLAAAFGDLGANPEFAAITRSMVPELPEEPSPAQLEAWVELAELAQDPDFRILVRQLAQQHAADRAEAEHPGIRPDAVAVARDRVELAVSAGIDPTSPAADPVVAEVAGRYADVLGSQDSSALRQRLLSRLAVARDPRWGRYVRLLAMINGWPAPPDLTEVLDWIAPALRARIAV